MKTEKTDEDNTKKESTEEETSEGSAVSRMVEKAIVGGKYNSEKKNLTRILMYSLSVNLLLGIVLVFFSISFISVMNNRDVSIIIPPGTHEDMSLSFGSTRVNKPVFEIYSDFLARGFGNFNYENVDDVYANLLKYSDGSVRHQMHLLLNEKATLVKDNFVTQTFRLARVELDRDRRGTLARCYGFATRKVGKQVQFEELPYLLTFWFKSYMGNVSIIGMSSEINKEPVKAGEKLRVDTYEQDNKYINF